jgi:hypothetical protein
MINLPWQSMCCCPSGADFFAIRMDNPANAIYGIYSLPAINCPITVTSSLASRPFYSLQTLEASGLPADLNVLQRRYFSGDELLGYKVAICQRDVAILWIGAAAGLLFGMLRHRIQSPSLKITRSC